MGAREAQAAEALPRSRGDDVNGSARMAAAELHEKRVVNELRRLGFTVEPFGQALLSKHARDALRRVDPPTLLRWLSDFIAWRDDVPPFLVEAKGTMSETQSFSIETLSYECALALERDFGLPVLFVFADMTCNWASHLEPHRRCLGSSRGSGTPFVLVWKTDQCALEQMFLRQAA